METEIRLGSLETSELLIKDLYLDLRTKVNKWSRITKQTPQARMGYIGQHLVSVVTGHPGGKSGARGYDLIISINNGTVEEYGEIKTCYRVDQLGKCNRCLAVVSSIETNCSSCGSEDVKRNADSKWLIGIRNHEELVTLFNPKYYYLVLFEFEDINSYDNIIASIWQINPKNPGFALCMLDYYYHIRSKSPSKAPFNLWPYELKFELMKPELIYRSIIHSDNSMNTIIFPVRDDPRKQLLCELTEYSRSKNLTIEKLPIFIEKLGLDFEIPRNIDKKRVLALIQKKITENNIENDIVADSLSYAIYSEMLVPGKREQLNEFRTILPFIESL